MFAFDHVADFDAIVAADEPFALVRFGDGESALMTGKPHLAASGEWRIEKPGAHWLQGPLRHALGRNMHGYCVGLPSACCLRDHMELHHHARVPASQRTFATIFLHGNLDRMGELVRRHDPVLVGRMGEIEVPANGVEAGCDFDPIVAQMLAVDRPMFVSAGPLANVLIDLYWQRQAPAKRQIVLDMGSALDRYLTGRSSRYYHHGSLLKHHCTLAGMPLVAGEAPKPLGAVITMDAPTNTTSRIVIGRGPSRSNPSRAQSVIVRSSSGRTSRPSSTSVISGGASDAPATNAAAPATTASVMKRKPCSRCARAIKRR